MERCAGTLALFSIGALLVATPGSVMAAVGVASRWHPPQHLTWYWQLTGRISYSHKVAVYDLDGFDTSAARVRRLHASGRHVVCYIDAGTWENWRPDAKRFSVSVLGRSNGWPGERWLDIRRLAILEPIMSARLRMWLRAMLAVTNARPELWAPRSVCLRRQVER